MLVTLTILAAIPVMVALYYKVQLDNMNMNKNLQRVRSTYRMDR